MKQKNNFFGKVARMLLIAGLAFSASSVVAQTPLPASGTLTGGTTYTASGTYTGPYTLAGNVTIYVSGTAATINGVISGAYGITKTGSATLTLGAANTYTGATTISDGTIVLSTNGTIAASSGVTLNGSGSLFFTGGGNKTIKSLNSSSTSSHVAVGTETYTLTIGTSTTSSDGGGTFAGYISGAGGGIIKQGTATLVLNGANTYTGTYTGTTINSGTLRLGANGTIAESSTVIINGSGTFDISGNKTIKGLSSSSATARVLLGSNTLTIDNSTSRAFAGVISGSGRITKDGTGTLALNGANTYTGATTVNAGTLTLGTNGTIASSEQVNVLGSSVLNISAGNKTVKRLVVENAELILGSRTLTIGTSTTSDDGNGSFYGVISGTGGSIIKQGTRILYIEGATTYTGATTINSGTLRLNGTGTVSASSGVTINGSGKLDISSVLGSTTTIKALNSSSATAEVVLGSKTVIVGTSTTSSDGDGAFAGVISGTGGITKTGTATFTLNGANIYSGATTINAGTLALGAGGTIANSPGVTLSGAGKLDISAANKTIKALESSSATSGVVLGSRTLTIDNGSANTFGGVISGTGGITKTGTAAFTLNGANTYSGTTTVNAGTLALGASGTIANSVDVVLGGSGKLDISAGNKTIKRLWSSSSSAGVVLGSRTLTLDHSTIDRAFAGVFSGAGGSVTKQGTAAFTMSNTANTATGTFTASQGTVVLPGNWAGNFVKEAASTLTVTGNRSIGGTLAMNGGTTNFDLNATTPSRLSATGALTKSGTNTLNITAIGAASSYTLLSAASGVSTDNFAVTGAGGNLSATSTALTFTPSSGFVAVTDITGVPDAAVINVPLALAAAVVPINATNQTITWTVSNPGTTGGAITSGNIFTATAAGTAMLKATIANGEAVGTAYVLEFGVTVSDETGIAETAADRIKIYPNPASDMLNFSIAAPFELIDLQGKVLLRSGAAVERVNFSGLASGVYLVRLTTDKGNVVVKVVKE